MGNVATFDIGRASPFPGELSAGTHYQRTGSGAPLLLIHDLTLDGSIWSPELVARLKLDFDVVALDLYGHGHSTKAAGLCFLDSFLGQIDRLLDHLGYESCTLVGDGCSSILALLYAAKSPERVNHYLATNCPYTRPIFDVDPLPITAAEALRRDAVLKIFNESCRNWFSPGFLESHRQAGEVVRSMLERCDLNVYSQAFGFFSQGALLQAVADGPIAAHGRFLVGKHDPCSDVAQAERLAQAVGGTVEVVESYHLNAFEHADLLAERIRALHQG
ncbi:alpha/beta hydrolase [Methyloligella sp. 2.7D]|uniref:alpha/beta fold hydrolase n=1 Tax=unclassified Methyloligella TaxID=2625955 RepID=UPI00157D61B4|nr:alpha/beta hydrolase [Methyloligella sp. GL2]QKP76958.1 alpha/beta fold hydrolase [Methyloligella sp. GL2]